MSEPNNRPPEKTFRAGHVEAAVWSNEKQEDGCTVIQKSIRIQKRYKDKEGNWKSTDFFFPSEIPDLELVAHKAIEYTRLKESGDSSAA